MSELNERLNCKTPKWFKTIIKWGIIVAAAGLAVKMTAATLDDFTLNATGRTICNYLIIAGAVAAAVAKTAKETSNDD